MTDRKLLEDVRDALKMYAGTYEDKYDWGGRATDALARVEAALAETEERNAIAEARRLALEEAAKVAETAEFPEASKCLPTPRRGFELAQRNIAAAILALKGPTNG